MTRLQAARKAVKIFGSIIAAYKAVGAGYGDSREDCNIWIREGLPGMW